MEQQINYVLYHGCYNEAEKWLRVIEMSIDDSTESGKWLRLLVETSVNVVEDMGDGNVVSLVRAANVDMATERLYALFAIQGEVEVRHALRVDGEPYEAFILALDSDLRDELDQLTAE